MSWPNPQPAQGATPPESLATSDLGQPRAVEMRELAEEDASMAEDPVAPKLTPEGEIVDGWG